VWTAVFGLVLQGPWNHFFYLLLDGALPPTPDPFTLTTLGKVGIDQFVQAPIFTIIILYFFAIVEGKGAGYASKQVQEDLGGILIKNWSVLCVPCAARTRRSRAAAARSHRSQSHRHHPCAAARSLPATAINIAYCPPELRVLFLNCVFFGWVVYLSVFLNSDDAETA
jgi:peroxisomal membrane protein 2